MHQNEETGEFLPNTTTASSEAAADERKIRDWDCRQRVSSQTRSAAKNGWENGWQTHQDEKCRAGCTTVAAVSNEALRARKRDGADSMCDEEVRRLAARRFWPLGGSRVEATRLQVEGGRLEAKTESEAEKNAGKRWAGSSAGAESVS
jgi:hypothetical protein